MNRRLTIFDDGSILSELRARSVIFQQICEAQKGDNELQAKRVQCKLNSDSEYQIRSDDCLRICVLRDTELIQKILHEAYNVCLSVHPRSTKMYNDLKELHEARHFRVCNEMFDLSTSESRTLNAFGFTSACNDTRVEMG
ncbi:integrase [Gossypium australe]|uniref:Integrase n=1 Tax=Gossypium australe TaxID=47621 RepID=A0A5B6VLU4_9ROSI|nr:integrase [Gossypium australe]